MRTRISGRPGRVILAASLAATASVVWAAPAMAATKVTPSALNGWVVLTNAAAGGPPGA